MHEEDNTQQEEQEEQQEGQQDEQEEGAGAEGDQEEQGSGEQDEQDAGEQQDGEGEGGEQQDTQGQPDAQSKPESSVMRELRQRYRESERARKEAESKLAELNPVKPTALSRKPELAEFDFDTEKYEAALDNWYAEKQKVDKAKAEVAEAEAAAKAEWEEKLDSFKQAKKEANIPNYEDFEEDVSAILSVPQQSIIVKYLKSPVQMVARLGGNPEELLRLSRIADPIKFAIEVHNLEKTEMKTAPGKKKPPTPERTPRGGSGVAASGDSALERLRAEAEKTGDYSKVNEYRRKRREQEGRK